MRPSVPLRALALIALFGTLTAPARAYVVGDTVVLNARFEMTGAYRAYNFLAFGNIDFRFYRDNVLIAAGDFEQGVNGTVAMSGVLAGLSLAPQTYVEQAINYGFEVPVEFVIGTPTQLRVDFNNGIIRGYSDFYGGSYGLRGFIAGLDDNIAGPNTTLYASVSLGTDQPSDTAVPPDAAHAFFDYDPYPNALARVVAANGFELKIRPDGNVFVADFANSRITTTVNVLNPVPLPGALPMFAAVLCALLRIGRNPTAIGRRSVLQPTSPAQRLGARVESPGRGRHETSAADASLAVS